MDDLEDNGPLKKIGYWMTAKKAGKLKFDQLTKLCRINRIELIPLYSVCDLDLYGSDLDAIIHKLSDYSVDDCDPTCGADLAQLQKFLDKHPHLQVIDPIASVRILCDRGVQYSLLRTLTYDSRVSTPKFMEITEKCPRVNENLLKSAGITFPIICKPFVAHGNTEAHDMSVILHAGALCDLEPPCVVQSFIPHSGVLYKIFVIGSKHFLVPRPSLKSLKPSISPTIYFNSHDISKTDSECELNQKVDPLLCACLGPDLEVVENVVEALRVRTGMSLFGLDLIVEEGTQQNYIIDVNSFPGYDQVPDLHMHLLELLFWKVALPGPIRKAQFNRSTSNMCEYTSTLEKNMDSGLGTDSEWSDNEKRLKEKRDRSGLAPDWSRIKKFYGIPKPLHVEDSASNNKHVNYCATKVRADTLP